MKLGRMLGWQLAVGAVMLGVLAVGSPARVIGHQSVGTVKPCPPMTRNASM